MARRYDEAGGHDRPYRRLRTAPPRPRDGQRTHRLAGRLRFGGLAAGLAVDGDHAPLPRRAWC